MFLDRDGVIVRDSAPVSDASRVEILPGVPDALNRLHQAGYRLVVVTNQSIVARGALTESAVVDLQRHIEQRIRDAGGPALDGFYFCPHHPKANLPAYRIDCTCRKPRPGMLERATVDLGLDRSRSFMVGDRITDIEAGHRAGCRTIWVHTGAHEEARIEASDPVPAGLVADHVCQSLAEAADIILAEPAPSDPPS